MITLTVDEIPPIISAIDDVIVEIPLGNEGSPVTWTEPTATDNSGTATMSSRSHEPGAFFQVGTATVTYTFSDPSGNEAATSFTVEVIEGKCCVCRLYHFAILVRANDGIIAVY